MTGEPHALEQLLREDPDDVLSWQVYGDALLAQGDPRGELIALELGDSDEPEIARRIEALTRAQVEALGPNAGSMELEWRHGFVIAAAEDSLEFPAQVEQLGNLLELPQARLLSRLSLRFERWSDSLGDDPSAQTWLDDLGDRAATIPALAGLDLRRLCSLSFAYSAAGEPLARLLATLELPHLRELDLRYCALTDTGAEALARNESLRQLRVLRLQVNDISSTGIEALASAPALTRLELLDLRGNPIRPAGARALASSPQLATLERLHLDSVDVQREGFEALGASTTLRPALARLCRARSVVHGR